MKIVGLGAKQLKALEAIGPKHLDATKKFSLKRLVEVVVYKTLSQLLWLFIMVFPGLTQPKRCEKNKTEQKQKSNNLTEGNTPTVLIMINTPYLIIVLCTKVSGTILRNYGEILASKKNGGILLIAAFRIKITMRILIAISNVDV